MSTYISVLQALLLEISLVGALQVMLFVVLTLAFVILFQPLLRGIGRATVLLVRLKLKLQRA